MSNNSLAKTWFTINVINNLKIKFEFNNEFMNNRRRACQIITKKEIKDINPSPNLTLTSKLGIRSNVIRIIIKKNGGQKIKGRINIINEKNR